MRSEDKKKRKGKETLKRWSLTTPIKIKDMILKLLYQMFFYVHGEWKHLFMQTFPTISNKHTKISCWTLFLITHLAGANQPGKTYIMNVFFSKSEYVQNKKLSVGYIRIFKTEKTSEFPVSVPFSNHFKYLSTKPHNMLTHLLYFKRNIYSGQLQDVQYQLTGFLNMIFLFVQKKSMYDWKRNLKIYISLSLPSTTLDLFISLPLCSLFCIIIKNIAAKWYEPKLQLISDLIIVQIVFPFKVLSVY